MNAQDLINEIMNQLNEQKLALKEQLSAIDKEIDHLNEKIRGLEEQLKPLIAQRAELMSQRAKVTKLLSLLEPTENMNVIIGGTARRKRDSELDEKVYKLLLENGQMTQLQIARMLGKPPSTIYHAINRLIASGKVTKDGPIIRPL